MSVKITVIVASYNNARFLPLCLDSLIHQTYAAFEVLVIDDCSTDQSLEIARQYSQRDPRVRVISTQKNQGVTYSKHVGLQAARGEYIAILDSDDIAQPWRLEKQAMWLDSHPETVLVAGDYGVIDAAGKIIKRRKRVPYDDISIRWRLIFGNCLIHSTVMYRRQPAIDSGGYDLYYFHGEDLDLYTKLLRHGEFAAIQEVVTLWRSHRGSVTKSVAYEERDRFYIELIQRSIQWQTNQNVDLDVAAAVFFNTKQPAKNEVSFLVGIETMIAALDRFDEAIKRNAANQQQLARCFIKHLMRIRKRNKNQSWWNRCYRQWIAALHHLIRHRNYRWYFDGELWRTLQPNELIHLIKANLLDITHTSKG